jgi:anti-anti-sigma regulatory factor
MSDKFSVELEVVADKVTASFSGQLDEDANFSKVTELNAQSYVFDLKGIEFVNSCGIREWIKFIERLNDGVKTVYRHCPQIIVEQINMVRGFIKEGGVVESFYAPYYSERDDKVKHVLLTKDQVLEGKAPEVEDDESGETLEFDDIEEQYFNFLKNS